MKIKLIFLLVASTLSCTNRSTSDESSPDRGDREFAELSLSEKLGIFPQVGEEFKGDYRKFSGQNEDSTRFQLTLNKDKRFAIALKLFSDSGIRSGDSVITFQFSTTSEFKNICVGNWTDEGKMVKLKCLLGQSAFFDSVKNVGVIEVIDDKTVLLDKDAKEVWISGALCKLH